MKKRNIILTITIISITIIIFITYIFNSNSNDINDNNNNQNLTINEDSECDHKPKLYYQNNNQKIYTYCLDKIELTIDNEPIELKEYLKNNSINDLINSLEKTASLYDGGTNIYNDGGSKRITNNGITLIKCNTIDGNKDIYIGNKDMEYKSNFCKDNNSTFTRTYTIKKIKNYTKQQYEDGIPVTYSKSLSVTLSQFQGETKTVIINNIFEKLEKNKTYEFEFRLRNNTASIEDNIESIFKNTDIIEVRQTNKKGLSQIQDPIN